MLVGKQRFLPAPKAQIASLPLFCKRLSSLPDNVEHVFSERTSEMSNRITGLRCASSTKCLLEQWLQMCWEGDTTHPRSAPQAVPAE